jgi:multidrug efflux pump subunit AcrB
LGITGVIITFFLHGIPLGFMAILGVVALSGVVVNNSLIILSFINRLRAQGKDMVSSIIEGCQLRLRAILITTLTTAAGTMPMAYGLGGNDPFIRPMALAFTWGLLFSTTLTLLVIPCFYSIAEDLKEKTGNLLSRLRTSFAGQRAEKMP